MRKNVCLEDYVEIDLELCDVEDWLKNDANSKDIQGVIDCIAKIKVTGIIQSRKSIVDDAAEQTALRLAKLPLTELDRLVASYNL